MYMNVHEEYVYVFHMKNLCHVWCSMNSHEKEWIKMMLYDEWYMGNDRNVKNYAMIMNAMLMVHVSYAWWMKEYDECYA